MPIEIRELIIKTEIRTENQYFSNYPKDIELNIWKKQLLDECKRMLLGHMKREVHKR